MKKNQLLILLSVLTYLAGFRSDQGIQFYHKDSDSLTTVTISIVGDLMCHTPQLEYAKIGKDSFDFKPSFKEIKKFLTKSDLTIGNLEIVIAGKERSYSGYPLFNSPDEYLEALEDAGFDVLFSSNNHSLDRGINGLKRTIQKIKEYAMIPVGAYITEEDSDSLRIIETNGIKLGLLAYTYGLNGNFLPKDKEFMIGVIDTSAIKKNIQGLQKENVDFILVYFHFGEEYTVTPSRYQKEIVAKTIELGADLIVASHPHVVQPIEYFISHNKKFNKGIVAFSLGNFISNQRWRFSDSGVILNLEITKNVNKDALWLSNVEIIPTWVFKGKTEKGYEFVILPSDTSLINPIPYYITKSDRFRLIQSFNDTRAIFKVIQNYPLQHLN